MPRPTTGKSSPVEGMGLVSGAFCCAAAGKGNPAAAAKSMCCNTVRRVAIIFVSIIPPSPASYHMVKPLSGTPGFHHWQGIVYTRRPEAPRSVPHCLTATQIKTPRAGGSRVLSIVLNMRNRM